MKPAYVILLGASVATIAGVIYVSAYLGRRVQEEAPPAVASADLRAPDSGSDPLANARDPANPAALAQQAAASLDAQDNLRSRALAGTLEAHPEILARQESLCGPGNSTLDAQYRALTGPPSAALRDLKVACMAKDIAKQALADPSHAGGVKNTSSL